MRNSFEDLLNFLARGFERESPRANAVIANCPRSVAREAEVKICLKHALLSAGMGGAVGVVDGWSIGDLCMFRAVGRY